MASSEYYGPLIRSPICFGGRHVARRHARMLGFDLREARDLKLHIERRRENRESCRYSSEYYRQLSTRLQLADDAIRSVLETYELLEMILLHLPMRRMLLAQRVSKATRTIIQRSIHLQRALYLLPAPLSARTPSLTLQPTLNNVIYSRWMPQLGPWTLDTRFIKRRTEEAPTTDLHLHFKVAYDHYSRAKPIDKIPSRFPTGSWTRMLLTQPACDRIILCLLAKSGRRMAGAVIGKTRADILMFATSGSRVAVVEMEKSILELLTLGDIQELLQGMYMASAASKNWREYADHKLTFKKNIDGIQP